MESNCGCRKISVNTWPPHCIRWVFWFIQKSLDIRVYKEVGERLTFGTAVYSATYIYIYCMLLVWNGICKSLITNIAKKQAATWNRTKCYVYWTVHNCDSWRITDQLDVTIYYVLLQFFYAQHVSDINTSIIRNMQLFYCITTLVVCSCFDVCWSFGVSVLGWNPCSRLHWNSNTHRNKNTRPVLWYNRKVAGSWWWMY